MGFLSWLGFASGDQPLVAESLTFEVGTDQIDPALFGLASWTDTIAPVGRVSRASAIQVPAVKRARDLICGTLGGIPMQLSGTALTVALIWAHERRAKLGQPDRPDWDDFDSWTMRQVNDYFAPEEIEVEPSEPETESGKGLSAVA